MTLKHQGDDPHHGHERAVGLEPAARMTWRDAFRAMAVDARARAKNSKAPPSGPRDPHTLGHAEGAAYAFSVMAEELEYLADDCDAQKALKRLRALLDLRGQR